MAKICIRNRDHFRRVVREARERGLYPSLSQKLHLMQDWGRGRSDKETTVNLGYDFAPMSFGFSLVNPGCEEPCIIGGVIFHPGASQPDSSMAVELAPQAEPHWSIHT